MKSVLSGLVVVGLGALLCRGQEPYRLDPTNSVIRIHLDTAGALGVLGHPHLIETPIERGDFVYYPGDLSKSTVEVVVDAGALQVVDPKRSAKERKEIQGTMQSERVLGITQYPKIVFKSSKIEPLDRNRLQVTGNLTIRSNTHPVILQVSLEQEGPRLKATGECRFKQTTFGMRPVAAGLATSILFESTMLRFKEGFPWRQAVVTAFSMSFLSMLGMELAANLTDYLLTGGKVAMHHPFYWTALGISLIAGFLAPLAAGISS